MPQLGRVDQHRKSRSYCRTERPNRKKPVLHRSCPIKFAFTTQFQHKREPCGIRKYPGGVFSRKAVADLLGQVMNGERAAAPAAMGKTLQAFFMSALGARGILPPAGGAGNYFWLKPGPNPGFQKGISPSADGDSGRCPENPQPFEKGWRKLQFCSAYSLKRNTSSSGV